MKKALLICLIILLASPSWAENYLLNGGQDSRISYQMTQHVRPSSGTRKLILSYVLPQSFESPTYNQKIDDLDLDFLPRPTRHQEKTDKRGNKIIEVTWEAPSQPVKIEIRLTAINKVHLTRISTQTTFPLSELPRQVKTYLASSKLVDLRDENIRTMARKLTSEARSEFDAVQQILTWVVDHMHYVLTPPRFDASYSFKSGKGNCQNYSHLAAALMRSVGIPVRVVNGITLKKPYDIKLKENFFRIKMAEGRHAWIEVYFPDLGWVPFDPSSTEFFVSSRYIRIEVGLDNDETGKDGLMRWTQTRGVAGKPHFEEHIVSKFVTDSVDFSARKMNYGPRKLLLSPPVDALFSKISTPPAPPPPIAVPKKQLQRLQYSEPYITGNLEFPINEDFLSPHGPARQASDGSMTMRKNFLVETAEYVTTRGQQYAQTFTLKKPVMVSFIGLALHKFNSEGQLWMEIYKDKNGQPDKYVATSDIRNLHKIRFTPGYDWVDFGFSGRPVILSPGRYWMALGFTGGPIVNWFFSYGKPVGPQDGTRYKTMFDDTWSRSLSYEFNYRVMGLTTAP